MVGLGQHPPFCRLLLSLGSQGRGRGTAAAPRVTMPGNNCVFHVGQNGFTGLVACDGTLSLWLWGPVLCPALAAVQEQQEGKATRWIWVGGGSCRPAALGFPRKLGDSERAEPGMGSARAPVPAGTWHEGQHCASARHYPEPGAWRNRGPPRAAGSQGATLGFLGWLEGQRLEEGAEPSQGVLPVGTQGLPGLRAVGISQLKCRFRRPAQAWVARGSPPMPTEAPPEVRGLSWGRG